MGGQKNAKYTRDGDPLDFINDPQRLAALDATNLMDSPNEDVFDRATRLATKLTGRPIGLLSLVDGTRQFFKAQTGLSDAAAENRGTPLSHSICQHVVSTDAPVIIPDARRDERVKDNPAIAGLDIVAYMGVPVRAPDGHTLGSFCVIDGDPFEWSDDDLQVLEDLSKMIEAELQLRETIIQRDMLIDEMDHRLKNVFTLLGGMVRQTARDAQDAREMADLITGRLQALSAAHSLILPNGKSGPHDTPDVSLATLTQTVLAPYPNHQTHVQGSDVKLGPKAAVAFALSLHELATNAAKYGAFSDTAGHVAIQWSLDADTLSLTWCEELPGELQAKLAESGFGSRLLQMNVEAQLGGTLQRELTPKGVHVGFAVPARSLVN